MILSAAGALVLIALLLIGRLAGGAIIVGLFASLAFGSTAIVAIPALGNSSPLIYTMFRLLLIGKAALEQNFPKGLLLIPSRHVAAGVHPDACSALLSTTSFAGRSWFQAMPFVLEKKPQL